MCLVSAIFISSIYCYKHWSDVAYGDGQEEGSVDDEDDERWVERISMGDTGQRRQSDAKDGGQGQGHHSGHEVTP